MRYRPVPSQSGSQVADVGPEAGDLQQHLGALGVQELGVAGGLAVLPDVVGDGGADVVLEAGVVGQPASRARVEVQALGLLAAVAAALPRVHRPGAAGVAPRPGRPASRRRWRYSSRARDTSGKCRFEVGQDEQLVPEDVAAVGLAVQSAGGHADVQLGGVRGEGLQDVEECAAAGPARRRRGRPVRRGATAAPRRRRATASRPAKSGARVDAVEGGVQRVADRRVPGGVQGDGLLDDGRPVPA